MNRNVPPGSTRDELAEQGVRLVLDRLAVAVDPDVRPVDEPAGEMDLPHRLEGIQASPSKQRLAPAQHSFVATVGVPVVAALLASVGMSFGGYQGIKRYRNDLLQRAHPGHGQRRIERRQLAPRPDGTRCRGTAVAL